MVRPPQALYPNAVSAGDPSACELQELPDRQQHPAGGSYPSTISIGSVSLSIYT